MPPKKKPDAKKDAEELPTGYNVDIMALEDLKSYAHMLENEIEEMRKHCNFYQKSEDYLVELSRITENDLRQRENHILCKDAEMEKLKLNFFHHIREKRQWPEYNEHASTTRRDQQVSETSVRLTKEAKRHEEEAKRLRTTLQEKDRQLESLRIKGQMNRRDAKERSENYLQDMDEHQKDLLEQCVKKFVTMLAETAEEFELAKDAADKETRESKMIRERDFYNACEIFKHKLHNYYKNITRKDLDTMTKLQNEISKLEQNIEEAKLLLSEAQQENKDLKEIDQANLPKRGTGRRASKFDAEPLKMAKELRNHNKIEQLTRANQVLQEEIDNVLEQTTNMRRDFTLALKKVRESAETKAVLLERKLRFLLRDTKDGSSTFRTNSAETETPSQADFSASSEASSESYIE